MQWEKISIGWASIAISGAVIGALTGGVIGFVIGLTLGIAFGPLIIFGAMLILGFVGLIAQSCHTSGEDIFAAREDAQPDYTESYTHISTRTATKSTTFSFTPKEPGFFSALFANLFHRQKESTESSMTEIPTPRS